MSSGCAVFQAEQHHRGGYIDQLADDHLFKADSKSMRVYRAAVILGTLTQIAADHVSGQARTDAVLFQIKAAAIDIGVAYQVANSRQYLAAVPPTDNCKFMGAAGAAPAPALGGDCYDPTFDLHMKVVVDDLLKVAGSSLPSVDLKRLISAMESGDYLGGLLTLWQFVTQVVDSTRTGFAGYRDLGDAVGGVSISDPNATDIDGFKTAYRLGEGSFETYAPQLDAYLAKARPQPILVKDTQFVPWFRLMRSACRRASWDALATSKLDDVEREALGLPNTTAGNQGNPPPSVCDRPAAGFQLGLTGYR